jgi:hypothetical protein
MCPPYCAKILLWQTWFCRQKESSRKIRTDKLFWNKELANSNFASTVKKNFAKISQKDHF